MQSAKELLVSLNWIERRGNINRFGETIVINPHWHRLISLAEKNQETKAPVGEARDLDIEDGAGGETPPAAHSEEPVLEATPPPTGTNLAGSFSPAGTNPAGLSLIRESLPSEESQYQRESRSESEGSAGPGIKFQDPKKEFKNQDPRPDEKAPPAPRLSRIRPEDFASTERALELYRQAVKCGLVPKDCEHARLLWMAAIERARTANDAKNPAGIFLFIVKNRKWDYLSDGHFDAANERLKKHFHAPIPDAIPFLVTAPSLPKAPAKPRLSRDALLLQVVRNELSRKGFRGDLLPVLRAHAGWDRERYEAAVAELEGSTLQPVMV